MFHPIRSLFVLLIVTAFLLAACTPKQNLKPGETHFPKTSEDRPPAQGTPDPNANAEVVGVHDGDTITVRMIDTGRQDRVRLATIDAPELNQPYGRASKKSLSDLVFGKKVRLDFVDRDQYGRLVSEVFVNGLNVNAEQIRRGFAWYYRKYQGQQTQEQQRLYAAAEDSAKQQGLGLWRDQNPVPPWEWRKEESEVRKVNRKS